MIRKTDYLMIGLLLAFVAGTIWAVHAPFRRFAATRRQRVEGEHIIRSLQGEDIKAARAKGRYYVELPSAIGIPASIPTLEKAAQDYSFLHVRVVDWDTTVEGPYSASFTTWYKLQILESLQDRAPFPSDPLPEDILPAALLPLLSNECLLLVSNGEMVVDGMLISRPFTDADPVLRPTGEYLLIGLFENSHIRFTPAAGVDAIFDVSGRNFSPVGFKPNILAQQLKEATGNNLDRLREYLRGRQ